MLLVNKNTIIIISCQYFLCFKGTGLQYLSTFEGSCA